MGLSSAFSHQMNNVTEMNNSISRSCSLSQLCSELMPTKPTLWRQNLLFSGIHFCKVGVVWWTPFSSKRSSQFWFVSFWGSCVRSVHGKEHSWIVCDPQSDLPPWAPPVLCPRPLFPFCRFIWSFCRCCQLPWKSPPRPNPRSALFPNRILNLKSTFGLLSWCTFCFSKDKKSEKKFAQMVRVAQQNKCHIQLPFEVAVDHSPVKSEKIALNFASRARAIQYMRSAVWCEEKFCRKFKVFALLLSKLVRFLKRKQVQ